MNLGPTLERLWESARADTQQQTKGKTINYTDIKYREDFVPYV